MGGAPEAAKLRELNGRLGESIAAIRSQNRKNRLHINRALAALGPIGPGKPAYDSRGMAGLT